VFTDEKCSAKVIKCVFNATLDTVSGGLQDKVEIVPCITPEYCGAISCDEK